MSTALWVFLVIIVVAFIIVFAIQATGLLRTRTHKEEADKTTPEPGIEKSKETIEDRLGASNLDKKGFEPRGDDVGGNFSGVSNRGDTSNEERR